MLDENIKSAQDRVRRTDLKAPVHGIVNKLNVTTIGAVVQPGANLMDIIPLDDSLLVEGRIRPQDIAFIRPNQDAVVKISAYDSSVYGSLKGKVERISADTIVDEKADKTERPENVLPGDGADREKSSRHRAKTLADHSGNGGNRRSPHRREIGSGLSDETGAYPARRCAARALSAAASQRKFPDNFSQFTNEPANPRLTAFSISPSRAIAP